MSISTAQDWRVAFDYAITQDGGLSVYHYYGFEPSRQAQKTNPFREERTSSFFISKSPKTGQYIFKDFGDDAIKGNCLRFIQLYENVDFKEAIGILNQIYNRISPTFASNHQPLKIVAKKLEPEIQQKELISIEFKDFTAQELNYWKQKGNISSQTLSNHGVSSVKSFKVLNKTTNKIAEFKHLEFVFAYTIVPNKAYKLYMPKENHRVYAKSKTVFLPNLAPAREQNPDYAYSFGLDTADLSKELIICGGEADCLALKELGYNAFTLGAETTKIPPFIWQKIAHLAPKNQLKVLYDTDYTGLENGRKLAHEYRLQQIILPKLEKQITKTATKPIDNDICDYFKLYGFDAAFKITLAQNIFEIKDVRLKNIPTLPVQKYLSEQKDVLLNFIQKENRILIEGDAGIGKTYSILVDIASKLEQPLLFVVPFSIQVAQIENEYKDKVKDLVCFSNEDANKQYGKVNICTYDKARQVFQKDMILFIDESHLLTSEYGYRTQAINALLNVYAAASKVIFITATPDYSFCQDKNFKLIRFKRTQNPLIEAEYLHYQNKKEQTLLNLLQHQSKDAGVQIVRVNNKFLAQQVAKILIDKDIYKHSEIDYVFSYKKKGFTTPTRQRIIQQGLIPDHVKLLFVTACFDCGINIKNKNIDKIISFETNYTDNCTDTFIQVTQRFRNLDKIQVLVCKPHYYQDKKTLPSLYKFRQKLYKDAQNRIDLLQYQNESYLKKLKIEIKNFAKAKLYIKTNGDISNNFKLLALGTNSNFVVNENYIRFACKEFERKQLGTTEFFEKLSAQLPNFEAKAIDFELKISPKEAKELKALTQKEKENKKNRVQAITQLLENETEPFLNTVYHTYQDLNLNRKIEAELNVSPPEDAKGLQNVLPESENNLQYDHDILETCKKYFTLKEMLLPKDKIPLILQKYDSKLHFNLLLKTLINQVNLSIENQLGEDLPFVMTDVRQIAHNQYLKQLIDFVENDLKLPIYHQKRTTNYMNQLATQKDKLISLQEQYFSFENSLIVLKTVREKRPIERKMKTIGKKIEVINLKIKQIETKLENTQLKAIEITELSKQMNTLKTHKTDAKGERVNIRILKTLFEVEIENKKILLPNGQVKEKTLVKIGKRLDIKAILQKIGFTFAEINHYIDYLNYKIAEDLAKSKESVSKNHKLDGEKSIYNLYNITHSFANQGNNGHINQAGYPAFWDN